MKLLFKAARLSRYAEVLQKLVDTEEFEWGRDYFKRPNQSSFGSSSGDCQTNAGRQTSVSSPNA